MSSSTFEGQGEKECLVCRRRGGAGVRGGRWGAFCPTACPGSGDWSPVCELSRCASVDGLRSDPRRDCGHVSGRGPHRLGPRASRARRCSTQYFLRTLNAQASCLNSHLQAFRVSERWCAPSPRRCSDPRTGAVASSPAHAHHLPRDRGAAIGASFADLPGARGAEEVAAPAEQGVHAPRHAHLWGGGRRGEHMHAGCPRAASSHTWHVMTRSIASSLLVEVGAARAERRLEREVRLEQLRGLKAQRHARAPQHRRDSLHELSGGGASGRHTCGEWRRRGEHMHAVGSSAEEGPPVGTPGRAPVDEPGITPGIAPSAPGARPPTATPTAVVPLASARSRRIERNECTCRERHCIRARWPPTRRATIGPDGMPGGMPGGMRESAPPPLSTKPPPPRPSACGAVAAGTATSTSAYTYPSASSPPAEMPSWLAEMHTTSPAK